MTKPSISSEIFNLAVTNLLKAISSIEVRILEVREFESQWQDIFKNLIQEYGDDVQIHIADQMILNTYRYDKFHVICDDILSLIENEIKNEFSVSRNSRFYLKVKPFQDFLDYEKNLEYLGDIGSDRTLIEKIFATEKRKSYLEIHEKLFGRNEDHPESWNFLKNRLLELKYKFKGLRNLFSHKHEIQIQRKYSTSWKDLEIDIIVGWFESFFEIVKNIYLLNTRTAFRGTKADFKVSVSNQIDLMLFGNIESCIEVFNNKFPNEPYWSSRDKFYSSRYFVDKVVNLNSNNS